MGGAAFGARLVAFYRPATVLQFESETCKPCCLEAGLGRLAVARSGVLIEMLRRAHSYGRPRVG